MFFPKITFHGNKNSLFLAKFIAVASLLKLKSNTRNKFKISQTRNSVSLSIYDIKFQHIQNFVLHLSYNILLSLGNLANRFSFAKDGVLETPISKYFEGSCHSKETIILYCKIADAGVFCEQKNLHFQLVNEFQFPCRNINAQQ